MAKELSIAVSPTAGKLVQVQDNYKDITDSPQHANRSNGVYLSAASRNAHFASVALSPEQAREVAAGLIAVADAYDAAAPKTFKQHLRDLHRGAVIRYIGNMPNLEGAIYTKVYGYGSDVFVRSDAGTLGSRDSHYIVHSDTFLGSEYDSYTSTLFEIVFEGVE